MTGLTDSPEPAVLSWLRVLGMDARDITSIEPLTGGLLNRVYRIGMSDDRSAILKQTPPYVASAPEIPLSAERARFEQAALRVLGGENNEVRVPRLLGHSTDPWLTLMEDAGAVPSWAESLPAPSGIRALGSWLARLHGRQLPDHVNMAVQEVRHRTQYMAAGDWMRMAGLPDADALAARFIGLGERWKAGGPCLIHGDLWLRSILAADRPWVIDWEFSTMGWPAQDLGHIEAHLVLHTDAAVSEHVPALKNAYGAAASTVVQNAVNDTDAALHALAEIGMRTFGPFHDEPDHAEIVRRVGHMARLVSRATY